ncbi:MAG TPA: Mrp/NBP35 family ATP-binding protein, partial [Mariprofundaceae bacterium]|nr:Mrp/NBP35 family ATP-binding protein [Mariprofundaceae bacterium]
MNHASELTNEMILDALRQIVDPDFGKDIVALGFVKDVRIDGGEVACTIELTTPACPVKEEFRKQAEALIGALPGVRSTRIQMTSRVASHAPQGRQAIPGIRNIIAVASGKGGVGKSTVAVNLAVALRQTGGAVGIVDSDVYGPDVPLMLGARGRPGMFDNKILPVEAHGLKMMSIGLLVNEREPLVWRGPMIHSFIQQMLKDVLWGPLDVLVFDMPPGTGDAQLSLSQVIPLSGVVMVTTPQDVALLDVRKAIGMFQRLNVPILGIVENMSSFVAPDTGKRYAIFGEGGGRRIAEEYGVPLLAQLPLDPDTRVGGDEGAPITLARPDSAQARA